MPFKTYYDRLPILQRDIKRVDYWHTENSVDYDEFATEHMYKTKDNRVKDNSRLLFDPVDYTNSKHRFRLLYNKRKLRHFEVEDGQSDYLDVNNLFEYFPDTDGYDKYESIRKLELDNDWGEEDDERNNMFDTVYSDLTEDAEESLDNIEESISEIQTVSDYNSIDELQDDTAQTFSMSAGSTLRDVDYTMMGERLSLNVRADLSEYNLKRLDAFYDKHSLLSHNSVASHLDYLTDDIDYTQDIYSESSGAKTLLDQEPLKSDFFDIISETDNPMLTDERYDRSNSYSVEASDVTNILDYEDYSVLQLAMLDEVDHSLSEFGE